LVVSYRLHHLFSNSLNIQKYKQELLVKFVEGLASLGAFPTPNPYLFSYYPTYSTSFVVPFLVIIDFFLISSRSDSSDF